MKPSNRYRAPWVAAFKICRQPNRKPDQKSLSGSLYWYGQDRNGKYMIRSSDHWGNVAQSIFLLHGERRRMVDGNPEMVCAKTYFV